MCMYAQFADSMCMLRGYEESMDAELQEVFNLAIRKGVTLFDTADSYGVQLNPPVCSSVKSMHRLFKPCSIYWQCHARNMWCTTP